MLTMKCMKWKAWGSPLVNPCLRILLMRVQIDASVDYVEKSQWYPCKGSWMLHQKTQQPFPISLLENNALKSVISPSWIYQAKLSCSRIGDNLGLLEFMKMCHAYKIWTWNLDAWKFKFYVTFSRIHSPHTKLKILLLLGKRERKKINSSPSKRKGNGYFLLLFLTL